METNPKLSNTKARAPKSNPIKVVQKEVWKSCEVLPPTYVVSSYGRIKHKGSFGSKLVEYHKIGPHYFFNVLNERLEKKQYMVAEIVLLTFRPVFHFGARLRFKDGNTGNLNVDNLRFKISTEPIVEDSQESTYWKCGQKANSSNERYKEKNREKVTSHEVYNVLKNQYFFCFYCGDKLDKDDWQLDHFVPVSIGGMNNKSNIVCACKNCNTMKGDIDGHIFLNHIEKLYLVMMNGKNPTP